MILYADDYFSLGTQKFLFWFSGIWGPKALPLACAEGWHHVASGSLGLLPLSWRGSIWGLPLPSTGVGIRLTLECVATGLHALGGLREPGS